MRKTLLVSVSTIALIAATGLAGAQEKGMGGGAQAPSGPSQMSPQSGGAAEPKGGGSELRGGGAEKGTTGQSSEPRAEPKGGADMKGGEPKASEPKAAPKPEPKAGTTGQAPTADSKGDREAPKAAPAPRAQESGKDAPKAGTTQAPADSKPGTTGQGAAGGAGAQLTTEQRAQISTTIRQVNVRPETNVNFSVSVGTVVPRHITLHVLPPRVVEIYPVWRGYRFILVGNDIIVIDPATYRIVAVIAV